MRRFQVENSTWIFLLYVQIGGTELQARTHFEKIFGHCFHGTLGSIGAAYLDHGKRQAGIWLPEDCDCATLAHEAFHVTSYIIELSGMRVCNDDTDECYAYLLSWIMRAVLGGAGKWAKRFPPQKPLSKIIP